MTESHGVHARPVRVGRALSGPDAMTPSPTTDTSVYRNVCRLCGAGCGILVETDGEHVVGVRGDKASPLTEGYLCGKARMLGVAHHDPRRFRQAMLGRGTERVEHLLVDVLDDLGTRLRALVDAHGPDSVGVYLGTKVFNESDAFGPTMRFASALRSKSFYTIDSIDVLAKVVAGLKLTGHRHSMYPPRFDFERARLVVMFGLNPVLSHTQGNSNGLAKLRQIKSRGEVWVVDPRRTETAHAASRHLQIRAGTDVFLLAHLVREILADGADEQYLAAHATGVDALRAAVEPFTDGITAQRVGLPVDALHELVHAIRAAGTIVVLTGTGTRMGRHATVTEWLGYVLAILTGSMDRVGGHLIMNRGLFHAPDWAVAKAPGPRSRPDLNTWGGQYPCTAMADEILAGNLKALIVFGGNPALAIPDEARIVRALGSLEVLAVHDIVPTATTDLATHVLPGTTQFEHAGVAKGLTPLSRRFMQFVPPLFEPTGACKPTSWYVGEIARRLGLDSPAQMDEDAIHDAPVSLLRREERNTIVGERVAAGGFTDDLPNGRWDLGDEEILGELARVEEPGALVLVARRQARHVNWYLTDLEGPSGRVDDADLLIHPDDAAECGVRDGAMAVVTSRSGRVAARVAVTDTISRGCVSLPHGFAAASVNQLTSSHLDVDPVSGMMLQSGIDVSVAPDQAGD